MARCRDGAGAGDVCQSVAGRVGDFAAGDVARGAASLLTIGLRRFRNGERDDPFAVEPQYLARAKRNGNGIDCIRQWFVNFVLPLAA